jgi:hypothetical protein
MRLHQFGKQSLDIDHDQPEGSTANIHGYSVGFDRRSIGVSNGFGIIEMAQWVVKGQRMCPLHRVVSRRICPHTHANPQLQVRARRSA